jgi:2-oxoisovalerate dehydrogenase E1 component beta subunit
MVHYCLEAANTVAESDGIDTEIVDLRSLTPLDRDTILNSVRKTSKALVVQEDSLSYGVGAEIAATIATEAFEDLDAPVARLAGPDLPEMPFSPALEAEYMLSPEKIVTAIRNLAAY